MGSFYKIIDRSPQAVIICTKCVNLVVRWRHVYDEAFGSLVSVPQRHLSEHTDIHLDILCSDCISLN